MAWRYSAGRCLSRCLTLFLTLLWVARVVPERVPVTYLCELGEELGEAGRLGAIAALAFESMPRALRSFVPGGFYHVTARGNGGGAIVVDDEDRAAFVRLLARMAVRFGIHIHAWCLMTNHYHLVLETPNGEVSAAIQLLNGAYARRFNERHDRAGHLFLGRFRASVLDGDDHLAAACSYVLLNPVRAGLVGSADEWRWAGAGGAVGAAP